MSGCLSRRELLAALSGPIGLVVRWLCLERAEGAPVPGPLHRGPGASHPGRQAGAANRCTYTTYAPRHGRPRTTPVAKTTYYLQEGRVARVKHADEQGTTRTLYGKPGPPAGYAVVSLTSYSARWPG